jgi:hypothetical protein
MLTYAGAGADAARLYGALHLEEPEHADADEADCFEDVPEADCFEDVPGFHAPSSTRPAAGTQFTCFTGTKVQVLTLSAAVSTWPTAS